MLCKHTTLSALAVVIAAVGCASAAPQGVDVNAILAQANAAMPNIDALINNPAFLASISKQMGSLNDFLANNPNFFQTFMNGINIPAFPTNILNNIPNNGLGDFSLPPMAPLPTNFMADIPTDLLAGFSFPSIPVPTLTFLDNLGQNPQPHPSSTKSPSPKSSPTKPAEANGDNTAPPAAKQTDESIDNGSDKPANSKSNAGANLKPAAGLFAAGIVAVAALF
ncbi:hypothetical protein H4S07_002895 [Coemansia furcata]|uniref:Uncharacterized protein n=1 Tax=Coemansia furcata TaxID=417177 RepID=A0ACC1LIB0_9FUNG|nr:hypothetical protein H4S07_002895 [Coemansia furcata]